jgi:hypothetical protein
VQAHLRALSAQLDPTLLSAVRRALLVLQGHFPAMQVFGVYSVCLGHKAANYFQRALSNIALTSRLESLQIKALLRRIQRASTSGCSCDGAPRNSFRPRDEFYLFILS